MNAVTAHPHHRHAGLSSPPRGDRPSGGLPPSGGGARGALAGAFGVILALLLLEAAGGWWTGSLALLADAGHLLVDLGSLGLGLLAAWVAARPVTVEMSYGYRRAEILAAVTNIVVLWAVAAAIAYEALGRLRTPHPVAAQGMLVVAIAGLLGNVLAGGLLVRAQGENLNVRAALAHVLADGAAAVGTIAAALIILISGWTRVDAVVGLGVAGLLVAGSWPLLREAVRVLMEGTPPGVSPPEVQRAMTAVPGVCEVHDLHVWSLTSGVAAISAHVRIREDADAQQVLATLGTLLRERFGLSHATLQIEAAEFLDPWHPRCAPGAGPHAG